MARERLPRPPPAALKSAGFQPEKVKELGEAHYLFDRECRWPAVVDQQTVALPNEFFSAGATFQPSARNEARPPRWHEPKQRRSRFSPRGAGGVGAIKEVIF
jgi:hypothetical protein